MKIKKIKLSRFNTDFKADDKIILRDYLAIERTRLANERTLLSYVRSSLYMLLGGMAFYQLKEFPNFKYLAMLSFIFCAAFFLIGVLRFVMLKKSLKKLYYMSESMESK